MTTANPRRRPLPLVEALPPRVLLSTSPMVTQTNLISDGAVPAAHMDPNLKNPWGIALGAGGDLWIADNNSGLSAVYSSTGATAFNVTIPTPGGVAAPAGATGTVVNKNASAFMVSANGSTGSANFLFATEEGIIAGWAPGVDFLHAVTAVDNSGSAAVFKGLATGLVGKHRHLYATDIRNAKIDEFNAQFQPRTRPGDFTDPMIPAGFAPFGIHRINGNLYVTYAKQNDAKHDDVPGAGNGFVDVYSTRGVLLQRLASGGALNSPWGVTVAPPTFGALAGDILVGNFGDGRINAFQRDGTSDGPLMGNNGAPLVIDGLWAITRGNAATGNPDAIFFAAGTNNQADGLVGMLTA